MIIQIDHDDGDDDDDGDDGDNGDDGEDGGDADVEVVRSRCPIPFASDPGHSWQL